MLKVEVRGVRKAENSLSIEFKGWHNPSWVSRKMGGSKRMKNGEYYLLILLGNMIFSEKLSKKGH